MHDYLAFRLRPHDFVAIEERAYALLRQAVLR